MNTNCLLHPVVLQLQQPLQQKRYFSSRVFTTITTNTSTDEQKQNPAEIQAASLPVVRIITVEVMPGRHEEFYAWRVEGEKLMTKLCVNTKVEHFVSNSEGKKLQRTFDTVVMTFPSATEMEFWEQSEERKEWLERGNNKVQTLVSRTNVQLEEDFLYSWMSSISASTSASKPPERWRMALIIMSAIYPTALTINKFVLPQVIFPTMPWLVTQPVAIHVAVAIALTVPTMTYVSLPIMFKILSPFVLEPTAGSNVQRKVLNAVVVGLTYVTLVGGGLVATGDIGYLQEAFAI
jgi:antibiotic biosynthesis monooxygenase (ABM) superfamily enzyme